MALKHYIYTLCVINIAVHANGCVAPCEVTTHPVEIRVASEILQADKYAIDYESYRKEAFASDATARRFMILSHCGIFDAAGSETYAYDLGRLVEHFGDVHFVKLLTSMNDSVQRDILEDVAYDAGWGNDGNDWVRFQTNFPLVAERMRQLDVVK